MSRNKKIKYDGRLDLQALGRNGLYHQSGLVATPLEIPDAETIVVLEGLTSHGHIAVGRLCVPESKLKELAEALLSLAPQES